MKQFSVSLLKCLFVGLGLQSALLASPVNDSFSAPTVVTGLPATATGSNFDATLEVGEPLPVAYTIEPFQPAKASVWFTWTSPVTGSVQIDTRGSDFDTILAVWTGSTLTTLSEIGSNDYYFGSKAAVFIDVVQGTNYRIAIYGYEDARGEISLTVENDTTSRISGIVTGPDGTTPLAGIDIAAYYKTGEGAEVRWEYAHVGITRADGTYSIRGLESDTYRVQFADVEIGDYQPEYYDNVTAIESAADIVVSATTTVTGVNASLELASKITGTVTGPDGTTPLSGIFVWAYEFDPVDGNWDYINGAITLPDGTYSLGSLAPGTYRLEFFDIEADYVSEYYDNAADVDSATSITVGAVSTVPGINASLTTASKITGTVTGPDGTTPLSGIIVWAYEFDPANGNWVYSTGISTRPDGTYRLGPLEPGTYRLEFSSFPSGDYFSEYYENATDAASATLIEVAANTTVSGINASLTAASKITGRITGPDGTTPLGSIIVFAYRFNASSNTWSITRSTFTDTDGNYRLGPLEAGTYRVEFGGSFSRDYLSEYYENATNAASATSITVPVNTTVPNINASLETGSRIRGSVTAPNETTPIAGINIAAFQFNNTFGFWSFVKSATTQLDGTYQLGALVAGTYRIGFSDPGGNYLDEYYNNASSVNSGTSITVGETATVSEINASLASASKITGTVTGPNGTTPLEGISVTIYQSTIPFFQLGSAMTQANGSYQLGGLVAGTYRIGFSDPSGNYVSEYFDNVPNVNTATNITVANSTTVSGFNASLALGSQITGIVTGPNGTTPLSGIQVRAYWFINTPTPVPRWEIVSSTITGLSGSYQLRSLASGTYRIEFFDPNGGHIKEFYRDALAVEVATDVPVPTGTTVNGIDASLVLPTLPEVLGFRKTGPTSFEISFTGTPGKSYSIQESTSLTSWRDVIWFTCQHGVNIRSVSSSEPKVFWRVKTSFP